jgi:hypothetical protein
MSRGALASRIPQAAGKFSGARTDAVGVIALGRNCLRLLRRDLLPQAHVLSPPASSLCAERPDNRIYYRFVDLSVLTPHEVHMRSFCSVLARGVLGLLAVTAMGASAGAFGCSGGEALNGPALAADAGSGQGGSAGQTSQDAADELSVGGAPGDGAAGTDAAPEAAAGAAGDAATPDVVEPSDAPLQQDGEAPDSAWWDGGGDETAPCEQKPEVCNGVDDNCNGVKDEGDPGGGGSCDVPGKLGECAVGTLHCTSGQLKCIGNIPASPEICDGKDNNCDGTTDNNPVDTGASCSTGKPGVCAAGTQKCISAVLTCVSNLQPAAETCNGLDDDCDGTVDNGFPGAGQPCDVPGKLGECAKGQTNCLGGQAGCTPNQASPQPEVCDAKDNDCDGSIDESSEVDGKVCSTSLPGICATGKTQCSAGTLSCIPDTQPGSVIETCNGKDDNCNGPVDDVANIKLECATKFTSAVNVLDWKCTSGTCEVAACFGNNKDCDGGPFNGCEVNANTDVNHCGACGNACSAINGVASCVLGQCQLTCSPGYGNCDGNQANGCETSLSSVSNCGGCGQVCSNPHGTTSCVSGACAPSCSTGWGSCDGNLANGCETELKSLSNCGGCGVVCSLSHASGSCATGACLLASCDAGWGNCDSNPLNGCETNLLSSSSHCGACGLSCAVPNGTSTCVNGMCTMPVCTPGYADCDGNAANGCETNLNTVNNCGTCGKVCSSANGTPSCTSGTCSIACNAGWANCDGNVTNGCEVNTQSSTSNCGACGKVCTGANGTPTCALGACGITCTSGWGNCDGQLSNGCEINLTNNSANCGGCGVVCPSGASCVNSVCQAPLGCFRTTNVQQVGTTLPQYTRCESITNNGYTCINPTVTYGNVSYGVPASHSSNQLQTWCQQLGCKGYVSVQYGTRSYASPWGKLFGCTSYDESNWHWCDWMDGYWYNQQLDYHPGPDSEAITSITCN